MSIPPAPLRPLDYSTPMPVAPRRQPFAAGMFVTVAFFFTVITLILTVVVPRLEVVFADFGIQLPLATVLMINLSHVFRTFYIWIAFIPLAIFIGLFAPTSRAARIWMRAFIMLAVALTVLFVAAATFMPLLSLMDSISSGKK